MTQPATNLNWQNYIPTPVYDARPAYLELYQKAWELAYAHIRDIPGMPQNPYMDEAFCDTQVWIWDTCFMTLFCKYAQDIFPGVESLKNFYDVLYGNGKLPSVIPTEAEPYWTGAVPGIPFEIEVHLADNPPLFAWAEYENLLMRGDKAYIEDLLYRRQILQKHYDWIESLHEPAHPRGVHYPTHLRAEPCGYHWEGGCSGMDNTPRGRIGDHAERDRPNNPDMLWVDAICQQALSAKIIAKLFAMVEDSQNEALWQEKFNEKANIVNSLYWDPKDAFYYDIDCNTHAFFKVITIASYWAMTAGIATKEQAQALVRQLENPDTFGGNVPLVSLSRSDGDYNPVGEYWRGSVWLPTAYAALTGLKNYGFYQEAHIAASKLLEHMHQTYVTYEPHTIWECYSPEEYKPGTVAGKKTELARPDFCGWSALGPISAFIEFVLGFHTVDGFSKTVKWALPKNAQGRIGIQNLRFAGIITDIVADNGICTVTANEAYTLEIDGKTYHIAAGKQAFQMNRPNT